MLDVHSLNKSFPLPLPGFVGRERSCLKLWITFRHDDGSILRFLFRFRVSLYYKESLLKTLCKKGKTAPIFFVKSRVSMISIFEIEKKKIKKNRTFIF